MPTARSALLLASALLVSPVRGKACEGSDLPADGELRIGRKYKPEVCEKLSKSGDYLRIHYTATTYSDCILIDESYYEGHLFKFGVGEVRCHGDDARARLGRAACSLEGERPSPA